MTKDMEISRLTPSMSATRLLATTVAGITALAVIALGVQIGTTGLGFDDDRSPASAADRRATVLVDLAQSVAGSADLAGTLVALLPPAARDTIVGRGVPQGPNVAPQPGPPGASEPPALTPPVPEPVEIVTPNPIAPAPAPVPPTTLPPTPGSAPSVEPVTNPIAQAVEDVIGLLGL